MIFFNNSGYLGMCGHGTIGLVRSLYHLGRIGCGVHHIETPVGAVQATLHEDLSVSVRNVPAYRYRRQVGVQVPGLGLVHGDIAWGGNWFFLISEHGQRIALDNVEALTQYTWNVRQALEATGITGAEGAVIDHIELFADDPQADSRNFVLCPGKAYDRSPAVPAPAPSWPAWQPTASSLRARRGARPASSAASSAPPMKLPVSASSRPCVAARISAPKPPCYWTTAIRSPGASAREPRGRSGCDRGRRRDHRRSLRP